MNPSLRPLIPAALFLGLLAAIQASAAATAVDARDGRIDRLDNAAELLGSLAEAQTPQETAQGPADQAGNPQSQAEQIIELHARHGDLLDAIHGNSMVYYDTPEAAREALATVEAAQAAAAEIRPVVKAAGERYGWERGRMTESLDAAGVSVDKPNYMVESNARDLREFLQQLASARSASAQTIADNAAGRLDDLDDFAANVQQQRLEDALAMIDTGQGIDPNHPGLNRLRVAVEQAGNEKRAEQVARIDSARWPGHAGDFGGPGSIDSLAASVRNYLAADRDWGMRPDRPQEILSVAVRGPWQVARRDILGQPVQWRLPVLVAVTDEALRPDGIARAYELSMVAMEGAANDAPRSPPWDGFWVGENFFLERSRLP